MTYQRYWCYAWEDSTNPNFVKFGDHMTYQDDILDAKKDVFEYIRNSLSRMKYKWDKGDIKVHKIWDVSDYAKKVGRFYSHAGVDDYIRKMANLGPRLGGRGDFHQIKAEDLIISVNKELNRFGLTLPEAKLSTLQYKVAEEILERYQSGDQIILADLCARFGKTIWSGAIAKELNFDLVIIASYVGTVFQSFAKDLTSFSQWQNYVHVDTIEKNWKNIVTENLRKKPIVAYMSMCNGGHRQNRIDWLFSQQCSRFLIIDEADFGVHRPKQTKPLVDAVKQDDKVLLMTGTNPDRATSLWKIDYTTSVTYPELLVQKNESKRSLNA